MTYGLGVDLGTTWTAAAVRRGDRVEVLQLGGRRAEIPSVIFAPADGPTLVGEPAARRGEEQPARVAREFKRRVGDPVPLLVGGAPHPAHALLARQIEHVLAVAATNEQGPPESVVLTCPANWGPYKRDLLEQAARMADVPAVVLRTEPEAAAIEYAAGEHMGIGDIVAVYDLGGGTFDAAVLRRTEEGFDLLGVPEGIEQLGGADFDEAVFEHVAGMLPGELLAGEDPEVVGGLARLRRDCVEAKEALSYDTEVMIPVALPGLHTRVRLTRREFEAMITPALQFTVGALRRALRSAGVVPEGLRAILLAGGSSRIPLVGSMVATAFDRPVVVDPHPEHSIALGAARLTAFAPSRLAPTGPAPAPPVPITQPASAPPPAGSLKPPASHPPELTPTPGTTTTPGAEELPVAETPKPRGRAAVAGGNRPAAVARDGRDQPTAVPGENRHQPTATARDLPAAVARERRDEPAPTAVLARPQDGRPAHTRRTLLLVLVAVLLIAAAVPTALYLQRDRDRGTGEAAGPTCGFVDGFDGAALDPAWERTQPDSQITVASGVADLDAPDGADIYNDKLAAPMLLREITGDFVLETTLEAEPSVYYQGAGLVLWEGSTSYVRLERGFGDTGAMVFEYKNGGDHQRVHGPRTGQNPVVTEATRVDLRLTRAGGTVTAAWRPAGEGEFAGLGVAQVTLKDTVRVGVSVLNRAQGGATPTTFRGRFDRVSLSC